MVNYMLPHCILQFEFKDVKFNQAQEQILAVANIGQVQHCHILNLKNALKS